MGLPFGLLLVWLVFELARPANPMGIPMIVSLTSVGLWIARKDKRLGANGRWWFLLLGVMIVGVPLAYNGYSAYLTARLMTILILCICLPLQSLLTTLRHFRVYIATFLVVMLYVGAVAARNGGYGPAGAAGGQDENYVAAMMGMTIPFAYFSLYVEKSKIVKAVLVTIIVVAVAAVALAANASRGGFLGLCAVALFCVMRSPRKQLGFAALGIMGVALMIFAGPSFWEEISTTTDTESGTGNLRLWIWGAGVRMWLSNPLIGVGPGNFPWEMANFESAEQVAFFGRSMGGAIIAHSLFVELLAELGLVGVIASAALVWHAWKGLDRVRRGGRHLAAGPAKGDPDVVRLYCYADAIQAGILALLVNGVFLSLMYYSHLWLLVVLGSALPYVYRAKAAAYAVPTGATEALPASGPRRAGSRLPRRAPVPPGAAEGRA